MCDPANGAAMPSGRCAPCSPAEAEIMGRFNDVFLFLVAGLPLLADGLSCFEPRSLYR